MSKRGRPFETGHIGFNKKPEGEVGIRRRARGSIADKYIKVAGKFILYARYLWMHETGENLTSNEIIEFIDGNRMNCAFSNLKKTHRSSHIIRNIKNKWLSSDLQRLKDLYASTPTDQLQHVFSCSEHRLYNKAKQIGIAKNRDSFTDKLVATFMLSTRKFDENVRNVLMQNSELIQFKRQQMILNRKLKTLRHGIIA